MALVLLTKIEDLDEKRVNCFTIDSHNVAICKVKEEYFAVENKCSHADQTFDKGRIRGHRLLCPLHGAIFDVRDGSVLSAPAFQPIKTYQVTVKGGELYIELD